MINEFVYGGIVLIGYLFISGALYPLLCVNKLVANVRKEVRKHLHRAAMMF